MANEYNERPGAELARPPLTVEGFRTGLSQLEQELTLKFIGIAKAASESGEVEIISALEELGQRFRILSECIQPRATPYTISNLHSSIDVTRAAPVGSAPEDASDIEISALGYEIVHALDKIRNDMQAHRLITHRGNRLLRKADRESRIYNISKNEQDSLEMEE